MNKILSIFILIISITELSIFTISCNKKISKNPIIISVYNKNQKFIHNPKTFNKSINEIDFVKQSKKNNIYEYDLQNGKISLINKIIYPVLHGINLTKDNSITNNKEIKWNNEQILSGLKEQKYQLIKIAKTNIQDPFDKNKKINQKILWEKFYKNYSTSYDSYYIQIALLANENETNNNFFSATSNIEKINDKNLVREYTWPNNKKGIYVFPTLKVLTPVASIINWLNNPNNNFNKGYNKIDKDYEYQSARYIAIIIPNITIRFEFQGENDYFTFTATIEKIIAYANYIVYKNPNNNINIKDKQIYYGHQWFFQNYGFYNFDNLKNDNYYNYNFNIIPNNIKINKDIKIILGFVKKNDEKGILTLDENKKIGKNGQFLNIDTNYNLSAIKWKINVNSITNKY